MAELSSLDRPPNESAPVSVRLPEKCAMVELTVKADSRGSLLAIEGERDAPFAIARAYCVYGTQAGVDRGFHAHRNLTQLAVAVAGSCTMTLDDGSSRVAVRLDDPATGLLIGSMVWREMTDFSEGCVLMVLADRHYDEQDYIRDYDDFRRLARSGAA